MASEAAIFTGGIDPLLFKTAQTEGHPIMVAGYVREPRLYYIGALLASGRTASATCGNGFHRGGSLALMSVNDDCSVYRSAKLLKLGQLRLANRSPIFGTVDQLH